MNRRRIMFRTGRYGSPLGILLFLLPGVGMYTLLELYPILQSFAYSVIGWQGMRPTWQYAGLQYYSRMLSDSVIPKALGNNLRAWFLYACVQIPVALLLAYALSRKVRGASLFRTLYFIPQVTSATLLALLFRFLLTTEYGLNELLRRLGLGNLIRPWLSANGVVQWTTNLPDAWVGVGFWVVVFLAAISGIPEELFEAAQLDGANAWQELRYVMLPSLSGILVFANANAIINALGAYIYQFVMTQGGPLHRSETLASYTLYWVWPRAHLPDWGYASALAVLQFALGIAGSVLVFRVAGWSKDRVGV